MGYLKKVDPQIFSLIKQEEKRQQETLMIIPSENIASFAVNEAVGSVLGNKYAEGYPYKRYYQGQEFVDQVESLAIERAKKLFKVPFVNVQPYSGSPANLAVILSVLKPGQTIMGLTLASGGHLTHGATASFTGKAFKSVQYDVTKKGLIDYKKVAQLAKKHKPKLIIAGTTAYARVLDWPKFAQIAKNVNAYLLADISHVAGLIVGGAYPSPIPYADIVMTTTHKSLRGPRGAMIMVTRKGLHKDPELGSKINKTVFPGLQGGPHINTIAGIAVALKEDAKPAFKKYAKQVIKNAKTLAKELTNHDWQLVTGGTDSHLLLIDLRNKKLLGNTVAEALEEVGIVLNRNAVPFDTNSPFYPSGIRLGTPGVTSRGMKEKEMKMIAKVMVKTVEAISKAKQKLNLTSEQEKDKQVRQKLIAAVPELKQLRKKIGQLCRKFPLKKVY
jgi:glycine hydroxymethyltransferase